MLATFDAGRRDTITVPRESQNPEKKRVKSALGATGLLRRAAR